MQGSVTSTLLPGILEKAMGKLQLHSELETDGISCKKPWRRRGKKEHCARGGGRKGGSSGARFFPVLPPVLRECVEQSPFNQTHCPQQSKPFLSSGLCFSLHAMRRVLLFDLLPSNHKQWQIIWVSPVLTLGGASDLPKDQLRFVQGFLGLEFL